jgi:hypothetical protein
MPVAAFENWWIRCFPHPLPETVVHCRVTIRKGNCRLDALEDEVSPIISAELVYSDIDEDAFWRTDGTILTSKAYPQGRHQAEAP